jgi:phytoene/squalene synthetase
MRTILILAAAVFLVGCSNKDEAYKKAIRPLYDSLVRVRDDVKDGVISPRFSADCDSAKALLDKAHQDLSGEDAARPSFVNMEGALEGYIMLRSMSSAPPDKIKVMADGAAGDLEKGRVAMEKGD